MDWEFIAKLKSLTISFIIITLSSIIIPGFGFLFIFKRQLINGFDLPRLFLLCGAITIPIWLICLFNSFISRTKNKQNELVESHGLVAGVLTIIIIYLPIIFHLFYSIEIKDAIKIIILLVIILTLFNIIDTLISYFRLKN